METIEGLRLIKAKYRAVQNDFRHQQCLFRPARAGREVLKLLFVYLNTLAGLDYAIVNAERNGALRHDSPAEKKLAEDVLLNTNDLTLKALYRFLPRKKTVERKGVPSLTLEERPGGLYRGRLQGWPGRRSENGALRYTPWKLSTVLNESSMEEVGVLLQPNQLIVAEELQSAES